MGSLRLGQKMAATEVEVTAHPNTPISLPEWAVEFKNTLRKFLPIWQINV